MIGAGESRRSERDDADAALATVLSEVGASSREEADAGKPLYEAVTEAARQRFRPIMMTSVAFSLGVLPLVLSAGAGANGRNTIGATVLRTRPRIYVR